jgi:hypothetical protein
MFDLAAYQRKAQETVSPKLLFYLWEDVCHRYDRGEIGQYELEEMKQLICPTLDKLAKMRRSVDDTLRCA